MTLVRGIVIPALKQNRDTGKTKPMHLSTAAALAMTDVAKVRLGAMSPVLAQTDAAKVRLGAMSPALAPTDAAKVRLGAMAPSLPLAR
jgi:hypothetical protein